MSGPPRKSSRRRGRRSRRSAGHDAAQAEAESADAQRVPSHPLIPSEPVEIIDEGTALHTFAEGIRAAGSFAYDTEFIGEDTYFPRLCLIQLATTERIAIVDPLAGVDLTPVWELIADGDVETIVHAGQQDLEPVVRHLGRSPHCVFDTQIAAGFASRPYPLGLRQLVEEFVGVHLGKALTFTNWDARPISNVHRRYAADDVRYLPAVRAALRDALEATGLAAWAAEECAGLSEMTRYGFDPDARFIRLLGNRSLKTRNMAVLRELIIFRDGAARELNVPPQTFLKDDVVLRLAKEPVRAMENLPAVKGLPRPVVERFGTLLLAATSRGLGDDAPELPVGPAHRERPRERVAIDALWALVCSYCRGRGIDPALVTTRREITQLYLARSHPRRDPPPRLRTGWRDQFVGALLDEFLEGRRTIELTWEDGELRAHDR